MAVQASPRSEPQQAERALGKAQLSREEEADRDLRHTVFAPGVAGTLCALFLLTILSVPVIQHVVEVRRNLAARREAALSGAAADLPLLPQSYDVLGLLPSPDAIRSVRSPRDAVNLLPRVDAIRAYETALEERSVFNEWVLPRMQYALTGLLGAGNEQAYPGRDGWLLYRPEVDYLTSAGFLEPATLRARARSGDEASSRIQPDPVEAITRFHRQLAERGITLIVMPAPVKPMIHPEKLSARYAKGDGPLQNPSYARFRQALEREGIPVFDASEALMQAKRQTGQAQFLETDTHWTPAAMERAAAELARFIRTRIPLPPRPPVPYTRRPEEVSSLGDIALMLKLPPQQRLYKEQRVRVHAVRTPDGALWRAERDADILLLGDSFSNIYSLGGMGWGEAAGFVEQLSAALQRPLDRIVINAGGSYSTRQRLRQELARGRDRLAGKRLVIWQFAMRDLLAGDWKLLDLPQPRTHTTSQPETRKP